jgi:hypothetical protein
MTRVIRIAILLTALALTGCGGTADLSGKVTYQGKPVVYGSVVVIGSDGVPKSGEIKPDGTYRVNGVKVGSAKVAVSSPRPPGSDPPKKVRERGDDGDKPPPEVTPAPPEVIKNWFPIPNKYGDPAKSELTVDVQSGKPLDIDLK